MRCLAVINFILQNEVRVKFSPFPSVRVSPLCLFTNTVSRTDDFAFFNVLHIKQNYSSFEVVLLPGTLCSEHESLDVLFIPTILPLLAPAMLPVLFL